MNIIIREIKKNFKSFLIWTICLSASTIGMMAFFPTFQTKMQMMDVLNSFPKEMITALGLDVINFAKIQDYLSYILSERNIFIGVYAMLLGASILSKEESDKTAEFLLSKPVTRSGVVFSKYIVSTIYITLLVSVQTVSDYASIKLYSNEDINNTIFIWQHLGIYMMSLTFGIIGMLISTVIYKAKTILPLSIGFVLFSYFISIVTAIIEKIEKLKYISPIKFANPTDIIKNGRVLNEYMYIMLGVYIVSLILIFVIYNKKEIHV